jgi:hypothetical protein
MSLHIHVHLHDDELPQMERLRQLRRQAESLYAEGREREADMVRQAIVRLTLQMRSGNAGDSLIGSVTTGIRKAAGAVRKAPDLIHNVNASAR